MLGYKEKYFCSGIFYSKDFVVDLWCYDYYLFLLLLKFKFRELSKLMLKYNY